MMEGKTLAAWLDEYYSARPQLKTPKMHGGFYQMGSAINPLQSLFNANRDAQDKLTRLRAENGALRSEKAELLRCVSVMKGALLHSSPPREFDTHIRDEIIQWASNLLGVGDDGE